MGEGKLPQSCLPTNSAACLGRAACQSCRVAQSRCGQHLRLLTALPCCPTAQRGKTPIVVGGTGFYLRWFILGKPATPGATPASEAAARERLDQVCVCMCMFCVNVEAGAGVCVCTWCQGGGRVGWGWKARAAGAWAAGADGRAC